MVLCCALFVCDSALVFCYGYVFRLEVVRWLVVWVLWLSWSKCLEICIRTLVVVGILGVSYAVFVLRY